MGAESPQAIHDLEHVRWAAKCRDAHSERVELLSVSAWADIPTFLFTAPMHLDGRIRAAHCQRELNSGRARGIRTRDIADPHFCWLCDLSTSEHKYGGLEKRGQQRTISDRARRRPVLRSKRKTCKFRRLNAPRLGSRESSSKRDWRRERNWDPTFSSARQLTLICSTPLSGPVIGPMPRTRPKACRAPTTFPLLPSCDRTLPCVTVA